MLDSYLSMSYNLSRFRYLSNLTLKEKIDMGIKMSAEIRTAMRKLLRDHPNVLDHVKTKSEVNSLTRDSLVELADNLGIDFMSRISEIEKKIDYLSLVEFEGSSQLFADFRTAKEARWANGSPSPIYKGKFAFSGELISDLKLSTLGVSQTLKIKCDYQYTPEWQFACLDDKRLKYRHPNSTFGYSVGVFDEIDGRLVFEKPEKMPRKWVGFDDDIHILPFLVGPIGEETYNQMEMRSQKDDKINRKTLGFPPLDDYMV